MRPLPAYSSAALDHLTMHAAYALEQRAVWSVWVALLASSASLSVASMLQSPFGELPAAPAGGAAVPWESIVAAELPTSGAVETPRRWMLTCPFQRSAVESVAAAAPQLSPGTVLLRWLRLLSRNCLPLLLLLLLPCPST